MARSPSGRPWWWPGSRPEGDQHFVIDLGQPHEAAARSTAHRDHAGPDLHVRNGGNPHQDLSLKENIQVVGHYSGRDRVIMPFVRGGLGGPFEKARSHSVSPYRFIPPAVLAAEPAWRGSSAAESIRTRPPCAPGSWSCTRSRRRCESPA